MNCDLLLQAKNRITATLEIYKENGIKFLSNIEPKNYEFIDKKYGNNKYESYKDNQLYGLGTLYRHTHNIKPEANLHIVIPHGFSPGDVIWSKEILAQLPIACFSDYSKFRYKKVAHKFNINPELFSSIHPFKLLTEEVDQIRVSCKKTDATKQEAIYFPLHSTKTTSSNIHLAAENTNLNLDYLHKNYPEVNLCIYYIDYLNLVKSGEWENYRANFNKVYCCGSRYEPAFLVNLALILKEHKYLITEGVGSHIFYASMAKIDLQLLKYSESNNTYMFKDSSEKHRKDNKARQRNCEGAVELHSILDEYGSEKDLVINRYITHYLSNDEKQIENKYIQSNQKKSCRAFSNDFDSKIYPLVE